jgi:DNA-binding IclR family transcriptional regulator
VTRNLTRGQQRTLLALGGLPTTEQDLAVRVGPRCTVSTTVRCLYALQRLGLAENDGAGRWRLTPRGASRRHLLETP